MENTADAHHVSKNAILNHSANQFFQQLDLFEKKKIKLQAQPFIIIIYLVSYNIINYDKRIYPANKQNVADNFSML